MIHQTAPNWQIVIEQITATGMTHDEIGRRPEIGLTLRAVRYLSTGVQPIYHRGEALLKLWCERTGQARADVPMAEVIRGHRVARVETDRSPRLQRLPNWPPAVPASVKPNKPSVPAKRAPGRPKKVAL